MNRAVFQESIVVALGITAAFVIGFQGGHWSGEPCLNNASAAAADDLCRIAVVPLVGEITSSDGGTYTKADFEAIDMVSADQVLAALREAEQDDSIKGILLRIDSPGGGGVASEMIANALKHSEKPTVALIRETGTSGAYLAATGADMIIASRLSDVGGIGVTMSYVENSEKNASEGTRFVSLASAPFKDCGNPNKPLTAEERVLLERDLDVFHAYFVKEVAENRNMSVEKVAELADGSSMPGELALEVGLIDAIGDRELAREWFAERLGVAAEDIRFCQ